MLNCEVFYHYLKQKGVHLSTGVPDSLLKDFCAYAYDHGNDIITTNNSPLSNYFNMNELTKIKRVMDKIIPGKPPPVPRSDKLLKFL